MKTVLITHDDCLAHECTKGYQEIPDRLHVVLRSLKDLDLEYMQAPKARREDILRVHTPEHINNILQNIKPSETLNLDYDTALTQFSAAAAQRAVGAVCRAVDVVMAEKFTTVFCAVRPPGHHAEPSKAMGFCYFNSIAIAAIRAQQVYGLSRIAILDFDVHHGNGTQTVCENHAGLYFGSLHQHPHYPNTGHITSHKNIRNIPLPAGTTAQEWRGAFRTKIISDIDDFKPELILVSAGFDAHKDDPLGEFNLSENDYSWLAKEISTLAKRYCKGRMISVLEGGYNLAALANSAKAYVENT